jgi:hypothetical protein
MATWKEIVDSIAIRVNKPFDENLKEELYHILKYKRVTYLQQTFTKNPFQRRMYWQEVIIRMEKVDASECGLDSNCTVYKTKCKPPIPLRSSVAIYDYVGDIDGRDAYTYSPPEVSSYMTKLKYSGKRPRWFYANEHIYIHNVPNLKYIKVRGVFENPFEINRCSCEEYEQCFDENSEFKLPQDLLNYIIREILQVEFNMEINRPDKIEQETVKIDNQE